MKQRLHQIVHLFVTILVEFFLLGALLTVLGNTVIPWWLKIVMGLFLSTLGIIGLLPILLSWFVGSEHQSYSARKED